VVISAPPSPQTCNGPDFDITRHRAEHFPAAGFRRICRARTNSGRAFRPVLRSPDEPFDVPTPLTRTLPWPCCFGKQGCWTHRAYQIWRTRQSQPAAPSRGTPARV